MLMTTDDAEGQARMGAFLQGLQHLGWVDGRNVRIETRWTFGQAAAPPSSVMNSRRFMSNTENLRLLPVIPNIDRELPLASDLLPYHDIFAVDFLRCRTLGLEAQGPDFTRCRGP